MNDNRYPKLCFNRQLHLINSGDVKYNWATQVEHLFKLIDHEDHME